MSDAKDDPIWGGFLADWGHWIPELFITPGTLDALAGQVPSEWISAAKRPQRDTIAAIWQTASRSLPRFSGYLANEILSLAVVDSERPSSLCLRRRPGTNVWEDHLVRAFAHQATYLPAAWATIDDMLTDWERSD